ncbi:methionine--tRNA ligase, mitochondrial-like [Photinus pyralis]|uniref:methionine--tRNA ligase, mitochondrial-like n=1 Tax=Photinus pyralis TaxID=7054 RepID=UPI0012676041|nr:methionine--tRNA ligase, mitochondrial-like [Photinus pyralis]
MNALPKCAKFYITTPIYYVNADPHIGHLYTSLIADAAQRWQQLIRPNVKITFATGTDEHGSKIQQAALKNNMAVDKYCDQISSSYKAMSANFNVGYTSFIRTTDEAHMKTVQEFWKTLSKNGYIYSSKYSGWYCVSDETFLSESQLKETVNSNGERTLVSLESGHPVEWTEEQNYMFTLSKFQKELMKWLSKNDGVVKPKKYQKILWDMISNEELADVSISRPSSRVHWGVKVPGDDTQTVYVWLDALVNYLTVAGYPDIESETFNNIWPPEVQVIGKDIIKFHGIYWPSFLLAANLELPKTLFCHSHWTVDDEKMSKSKNNVVSPFNRSLLYTCDGLRYFLLREGVAHSDGNYSDTKLTRILNSELADTLGNLLSRCCSSALNPNQVFPEIDSEAFERVASMDVTKKIMDAVMKLPGKSPN